MEEFESTLESKAARTENGSYLQNDGAGKVSTEVKNGEGDAREEIKIHGEEKESSIEVKAAVDTKILHDFKYGEDNKNVKYGEENNIVKEIKNVEENKDVGETKVVEEKEANKALDGEEKEAGETKNREENRDLEKTKEGVEKKIIQVQSSNEMKVLSEANDMEENMVGEEEEDAGDKKALEAAEDVKDNKEKNGVGDVKAAEEKNEDKGSHLIDDKGVEELKDGKDEQGREEMKNDEHSEASSVEKDEGSILIPLEGDEGDKAEKVPKDVEMVDAEHVVENEATDVKDEGKLCVREGEEVEEDDEGSADKEVSERKAGSLKRKRGKGQRTSEKGEAKKKGKRKEELEVKETKGSGKKSKDVLSTPVVSSSARPVRERKSVERLVEVIEKGPDRVVIIEKGRGTPFKEIPNVAYKLARKKPADLKFLHQTLFGRKGKAVNFKSNLLQFSGFAWHESEEKQRAKMKEKLDKCVKETLLDLCDLFDLTISKTNTKKDDIIVKLLDFVEAPHANSGVILAEKEQTLQSSNSTKRKRMPKVVDASNSPVGKPEKGSGKKLAKIEGTPNSKGEYLQDSGDEDEDEDEEEDYGSDAPDENEVPRRSESDTQEKELEVGDDEGVKEDDDQEDDYDFRKEKKDVKKSPKQKERHYVKRSQKKQGSAVTQEKELEAGDDEEGVKEDDDQEDEKEDDYDIRKEKKNVKKSPKQKERHYVKRSPKKQGSAITREKELEVGDDEEGVKEDDDQEDEKEDDYDLRKEKKDVKKSPKQKERHYVKRSPKKQGSSVIEKKKTGSNSKKSSSNIYAKSPAKTPSSKNPKVEKSDDAGEKVFSRKKKDAESPKKLNSKSNSKSNSKEKSSGKKAVKRMAKLGEEQKSGPSKVELRKTICEILKEVDFNTATFTDILKKLAAHYKTDLTPRKATIKLMIQEELTKMADEAEDSEEEENVGEKENPQLAGKKVQA